MTILITGGCGFVGAHVVAALARRFPGEPLAVADLGPPPPEVAAFWRDAPVTAHRLDVTDRAAVADLVAALRPRCVVHGAAITPDPATEAGDPLRILDINIGGAASVLDAATRSPGIERVIAFSSAAVYPVGDTAAVGVLDEASQPGQGGLYAISKFACEGLARRFGEIRGVSTVAVRVAACYGAMERPTGHRSRMSQVYPLFAALREGRKITAAPSAAIRDWTDADDVGDAVAALLAAPSLRHGVYNIGLGAPYIWSDVIDLFERHGLAVERVEDAALAEATFDPALSRAPMSPERLAADTGFRPHRRLEDAVARMAAARPS